MKVRVRAEVCQGHSMCRLACPEIFGLDDVTGHASVRSEEVPMPLVAAVENAMASCPEGAIEITP
jgi:ferredoxin